MEGSSGTAILSKRKFNRPRGDGSQPRKKFKRDSYSGDFKLPKQSQVGRRGADNQQRKYRLGKSFDSCEHYTDEEISAMDEAGIQEPITIEETERIMNDFHDACHDPGTVSCVCDQFCSSS